MNNLIWLLRAAHRARRPPGGRRVLLLLATLAIAALIIAAEHFGLWPDRARLDHGRGMAPLR